MGLCQAMSGLEDSANHHKTLDNVDLNTDVQVYSLEGQRPYPGGGL